tara:strand:+ start:287 stop:796 length:510 start_codon:yes stop_codon:yes gene_type:complete
MSEEEIKKMKFTKTRKSEWFANPTMCGHIWSQETVANAEAIITKCAKTKRTKALANYVIRDIPDWHYWNDISKKHLNMLRFVLRRLEKAFSEKGGLTRLLAMYQNRNGCLKCPLDWSLEHLAYTYDKPACVKDYTRNMGFFGMTKKEATDRLTEYHKNLVKKYEVEMVS